MGKLVGTILLVAQLRFAGMKTIGDRGRESLGCVFRAEGGKGGGYRLLATGQYWTGFPSTIRLTACLSRFVLGDGVLLDGGFGGCSEGEELFAWSRSRGTLWNGNPGVEALDIYNTW